MLSRVYGENFQSWPEFEFPITPGVTLIDGWNEDDQTPEGSGKSSIPNAVAWCFFGQVPKDANIDDVIMFGKENCRVIVEFQNGDSIVRTRKPNDLFIHTSDGKVLKGSTAKETQTLIEEYLGVNFETFCQSSYFAQNYPQKFLTSNQENKGKILSNIQNLAVFDKAVKETQGLLKLEKDKVIQLTAQVDLEKNNISHLNSKIQMVEQFIGQKIAQFNKQRQELVDKHNKLYSDLVSRQKSLETIRKESETLISSMGVNPDSLSQLEQDKHTYNLRLFELKTSKSQIDTVNNNIRYQNQDGVTQANKYKKLEEKRAKLEEFIRNPTSTCPTCGSVVEKTDTSHSLKEVEDVDLEMSQILARLTQISEWLVQNPPLSAEEIMTEERSLNSKVVEINNNMTIIKNNQARVGQLHNQYLYAESDINNLTNRLTESEATINGMQAPDTSQEVLQKENMTIELGKLSEILVAKESLLNAAKEYAARLELLKDGFKEIKSYVFNNALKELNFRTNQYLQQLFEVTATIKFTNDDQKIESEIVLGNNKTSLGLLSGGQARRFNLAVDLALSDLVNSRKVNKVNVLVLDEYFKDLSEVSMEKCLTILKSRKSPVVLIEHNSLFKSIVDNTHNVWYENGQSTIK